MSDIAALRAEAKANLDLAERHMNEKHRLTARVAELEEALKNIHAIANIMDRSPAENEDALWEIHGKARAALEEK